jgi:hypothetical protein
MWGNRATRPDILQPVRQTNLRTNHGGSATSAGAGTHSVARDFLVCHFGFQRNLRRRSVYSCQYATRARRIGGSAGLSVFLRPLLSVVAIVVLGGAALGSSAGWGLLHFEPWARVLALVLAFLVLFINIPVRTAVGVCTMWVLLPGESEQEYEALVNARAV